MNGCDPTATNSNAATLDGVAVSVLGNLRQTVYFHQGHARGTPTAGHNRGVAPGRKGHKDGRLRSFVAGARRFNFRLLTLFQSLLSTSSTPSRRAIREPDGQRVCHAKVGKQGTMARITTLTICTSSDRDQATIIRAFARLDKPTGC